MKEIKLTRNKIALVDDNIYDIVNKFKWHASNNRGKWYARRAIYINGKQKIITMHNFILNKNNPNFEIDHIDGNGLNNQLSNLRECTHKQNMCNVKSRGSVKYLGVTKNKHGKFIAQISQNGKTKYLGSFNNETDAAKLYDKNAIILHGKFANLNFND